MNGARLLESLCISDKSNRAISKAEKDSSRRPIEIKNAARRWASYRGKYRHIPAGPRSEPSFVCRTLLDSVVTFKFRRQKAISRVIALLRSRKHRPAARAPANAVRAGRVCPTFNPLKTGKSGNPKTCVCGQSKFIISDAWNQEFTRSRQSRFLGKPQRESQIGGRLRKFRNFYMRPCITDV
jgi:hypothetical protein